MKPLLSYIIVLSITTLCFSWKSPHFSKSSEITALEFKSDSGYILPFQAEQLLHNIYPDSSGLLYDAEETDTIGKYYKTSWGNFYGCISILESLYIL